MFEQKNQMLGLIYMSTALAVACLVARVSAVGGGPIFVSPGGAYGGVVGKPVAVDASGTVNQDGGEIKGYYWDWFGEGMFECVTLPQCEHTWQSAYSGTIVLHVWDEHNDLGAGETPIVITGPENLLTASLQSHADLRVVGPRNHVSSLSSARKTQLPGSTCRLLDSEGKDVAGQTPAEGLTQVICWPLYSAGTYRIQAVGTSDGPCCLTICATQDGARVLEKTVSVNLCAGETLAVNVSGRFADGRLQVALDEPAFCPGVCVEPSEITLVVEAGKTYEVPLMIREPFSKTALSSVTLSNEDIAGPVGKVGAGTVGFSPQNFDLEAGSQTTVMATIPVPQAFLGQATGSIVVRSANGAVASVKVTLKTPGTCPPHCNGMGPIVGLVGAPVTFDASGSYDPDGEILQYGWDWDGDGAFEEWTVVPTITHTWNTPFAGKVRLIVFDNDNECADTYVDVTITNP